MKLPNEEKAIATIMTMAAQSLDPDSFEALESIMELLCETRAANIDQRLLNNEYEAIGKIK